MRWSIVPAGLLLATPVVAQPPAKPALAAAPAPAGTVAALVNGEAIPLAAVEAELKRVQQITGVLTANQVKQLRQDVVQDLIDDTLMRQYLRQHTPPPDPAEVDKLFAGLNVALQAQGKTLAEYLRQTGRTEAEVRAQWGIMLRFNAFAEKLATDAELRKYFEARRDSFDGSQVRVRQIVVRLPTEAPANERSAARAKLQDVRTAIVAGQLSFAEAADRHSVDATAAAGGDAGFLSRRDALADPAVTAAAFALADAEISQPVETPAGVYLLMVTERKPGTPVAFDSVLDWVREAFLDDVRRNLVAQLRGQATLSVTLPD